jgi:uncharacterized protein YpmB
MIYRYENLFNTAYIVSQNILPFTDYTYKWSIWAVIIYAGVLVLALFFRGFKIPYDTGTVKVLNIISNEDFLSKSADLRLYI